MSHLNKRIIFARRLALGKRRQQGYPPRAEPMRGLPEAGIRTSAVGHDFKRDSSLPEWHGWHAGRRGLGSNLYRLGVPELVIQRILRHANVSTTATPLHQDGG